MRPESALRALTATAAVGTVFAAAFSATTTPGTSPGHESAPPVAAAPAAASAASAAAQEQEEAAVLAAVERIFEGMRTADSAMVRSSFADDARFSILDTREGAARVTFMPVDGWIEAIAGSGGRWDERIYDVEVQLDQGMASVWAPYTFYLDGAIRHCGINSLELLRSASGWKITQVADTRRREDCPDPR